MEGYQILSEEPIITKAQPPIVIPDLLLLNDCKEFRLCEHFFSQLGFKSTYHIHL